MTIFFIKAILMSVLPFYRVEFPIDVLPKDFIYVEYDHGRELGRRAIEESDAIHVALKKLLSEERQGWRYDLITYVPNRMFDSPKMKINCCDNALVVNYEDNKYGWIQISKKGIKDSCLPAQRVAR